MILGNRTFYLKERKKLNKVKIKKEKKNLKLCWLGLWVRIQSTRPKTVVLCIHMRRKPINKKINLHYGNPIKRKLIYIKSVGRFINITINSRPIYNILDNRLPNTRAMSKCWRKWKLIINDYFFLSWKNQIFANNCLV